MSAVDALDLDHSMRVRWREHEEFSLYRGECSCGWRTMFETTVRDHVVDAMKTHADRVQAAAPDQQGQYL